ncbi:extracellular calcium-sensing receptor isoform X2 [Hydra vulgaris]|nr:extracellular calcium-sensing receptor isoform X2 [Hydra vulgaris]XP_047127319.1 extracellular calcium-sensing receptor isoform X2 [Hydra vulgaris]
MLSNFKKIFHLKLLLFIASSLEYEACTKQRIELSDVENASVVIGGLFPVHVFDQKYKTYVLNKPGLLWVEAMLFAIEEINKSSLLHKKIGYRIQDSCNNIEIAMRSTLEITQGYVHNDTVNKNGKCLCESFMKGAIALVGDAASETSAYVAAILSSSKITQISYSATSTNFNTEMYPSFLRTILPDNFQAEAIADLIVYNNWTYVSVIACDDDYGRVGFSESLQKLQKRGVCTAVIKVLDIKGGNDASEMEAVIKKLLLEKKSNVIVLWCQRPEAIRFLKTAEKLYLYNKTWIATESYGFSNELFSINPNVVRGMLGIIPFQFKYELFESRLKSMNPSIVYKNPWIQEYWKEINCDNSSTINCLNRSLNELPKSKYFEVINAVQSIARGLYFYIESENPSAFKPQRLLSYVKNVSFMGINNILISYDEQGNPKNAGYSITNLKQNENKNLFWDVIAAWNYSSREIKLISDKKIIYSRFSANSPRSSCKENCKPGYYALKFESLCCWECVRCPNDSVQPNYGQDYCIRCGGNEMPNKGNIKCIMPKKVYIMANSKHGILLILFSSVGLLLVIFIIGTFYKYKETPIVKASNINLSLMQLISVLFILMLPSFCIHRDTTIYICGGQLIYFACFNSMAVSVTFVKADCLLKIFKNSKKGRSAGHLTGQPTPIEYSHCCFIIKEFTPVAVLSLSIIVLCFVFLFSFPIEVSSYITMQKDATIEIAYYCHGYYNFILFSTIAYVSLIAFICGVYAFKARNLPETHNESQLTCLAMFLYFLSWLIFVPTYFSTSDQQQKLVVWCFMSNTSTICFFFVMYVPKLYIILFRPEENTAALFRAKITEFVFTNSTVELKTYKI